MSGVVSEARQKLSRKAGRVRDTARFLFAQRVTGLAPPGDQPLFDPEGLRRFKEHIANASTYLEFGSGGSTVFADQAGIPTISVESDPYYAKIVRSKLSCDCVKIIVPNSGFTGEWGTPFFSNSAKGLRYVDSAFPISPFPDFIVVDGRFRVACTLECARQANLTGCRATLMLDDYTFRPEYHRVEQQLGAPEIGGRAAFFIIGEQPVSRALVEAAASDKR